MKQFAVRGLPYDLLRAGRAVPYTLRVHTFLSGTLNTALATINGLPPNGTRHHFKIKVFLSRDKAKLLTDGDDVVLDMQLSAAQDTALKV